MYRNTKHSRFKAISIAMIASGLIFTVTEAAFAEPAVCEDWRNVTSGTTDNSTKSIESLMNAIHDSDPNDGENASKLAAAVAEFFAGCNGTILGEIGKALAPLGPKFTKAFSDSLKAVLDGGACPGGVNFQTGTCLDKNGHAITGGGHG